eukprot:g4557.t1
MGHKQFRFRGVHLRPVSRRTEAEKYDIEICTNFLHHKTERVIVQKAIVDAQQSEEDALEAAEKAAYARDFGPTESTSLENRLQTHFRITVVSERFRFLNLVERYSIVFESLMGEFWDAKRLSTLRGPSCWKSYGTTGVAVRNLPPYRYFFRQFTLQLKSPEEWHMPTFQSSTLEQRYGDSLIGTGVVRSREAMNAKRLARFISESECTGQSISNVTSIRFDGLVNTTTSCVSSSSHHSSSRTSNIALFDDDRSSFRDGTLSRRTLVQQLNDTVSFGADGARSAIAKRSHQWASSADSKDPAEIQRHFLKCQVRLGKAAICFQQNFRRHLSRRMHRAWLRRHRAAICIGRLYRGYVSRVYVKEFRIVCTDAATALQSFRRAVLGRRYAHEYRVALTRACRRLQPIIRGFLCRTWTRMESEKRWAAMRIQRNVRGFLARAEFRRRLARRVFATRVVPAVLTIQCAWRGALARAKITSYRCETYHRQYVIRACCILQRYVRGFLGRCVAWRMRRREEAARDLQRIFRGGVARRLRRALLDRLLREHMAVRIQASVRRYLCARLRIEMREKSYFYDVLHPNAVRVQKLYRGHRCRKLLLQRRAKSKAARTVQGFWIAVLSRRRAMRDISRAMSVRRDECALLIQTSFRAYSARMRARTLHRVYTAKTFKGALKFQQQWRIYTARRQMRRIRQDLIKARHKIALKECTEDANEIVEEIAQLRKDCDFMRHIKRRVAQQMASLRKARNKMSQRIPDVEKEIEDLDADDERAGWMEALENEWTSLQQNVAMAKAEMEAKALQLEELNEKIEGCVLEIEELEFDLDECESQRMRSHCTMQQNELEESERDIEREWVRRVRKQKQIWGVRNQDLRRNVVLREFGRTNPPPDPSLNPLSMMSSVSYKDNRDRKARLSQWQREMKFRDRAVKWAATQANGSENPVWKETYGRATSNVLGLMKLVSFASAFKHRELDDSKMTKPCLVCGKANCACNFVPEKDSLF